jgi:hypothetical protein
VTGNTGATDVPEGADAKTVATPVNPEVSGFEIVGMLGMRYHATKSLILCMGVTYDNNNAFLVRPGLIWKISP